jgi:hypothetical protein
MVDAIRAVAGGGIYADKLGVDAFALHQPW